MLEREIQFGNEKKQLSETLHVQQIETQQLKCERTTIIIITVNCSMLFVLRLCVCDCVCDCMYMCVYMCVYMCNCIVYCHHTHTCIVYVCDCMYMCVYTLRLLLLTGTNFSVLHILCI